MSTYKGYTISTWQDSLGNWHATVIDADGNSLATVPQDGNYGKSTEQEAVAQAKQVVTRFDKAYHYAGE